MRFAMMKKADGGEVLAFGSEIARNPWIYWSDLQKKFPHEKVVQQTHSLLDLVKRSSFLLPWLQSQERQWRDLPHHRISNDEFSLAISPPLFRDFYAFEEHVKKGRMSRGLQMIPEWYEAPVFYYSNPFSFKGAFEPLIFPKGVTELDCELEIACIVGKELYNATLDQAADAIFGYTILNDWSARNLQRFEMKLNMGPMKAKDFATSLGSFIVTKDLVHSKRHGKGYSIDCEWRWNGEAMRRNSWETIQFSFEEMLVRASQNCRIFPGEIIASGTMGGGCLFEQETPKRWLEVGDRIEMDWLVEGPQISCEIYPEQGL